MQKMTGRFSVLFGDADTVRIPYTESYTDWINSPKKRFIGGPWDKMLVVLDDRAFLHTYKYDIKSNSTAAHLYVNKDNEILIYKGIDKAETDTITDAIRNKK